MGRNKGGWEYCKTRTFINNEIYDSLPNDLKSDYGTYSNYTSNSIAGISPAFRIG